jgi:WD40 repeat protein
MLTSYVILPVNEGCVTISLSPDCSHVFAGTLSGKLISWQINLSSETLEANAEKIQVHDDSIYGIQYLPRLKGIVTGSRDKSVKLWHTSTTGEPSQNGEVRQPLRKFIGHKASPQWNTNNDFLRSW